MYTGNQHVLSSTDDENWYLLLTCFSRSCSDAFVSERIILGKWKKVRKVLFNIDTFFWYSKHQEKYTQTLLWGKKLVKVFGKKNSATIYNLKALKMGLPFDPANGLYPIIYFKWIMRRQHRQFYIRARKSIMYDNKKVEIKYLTIRNDKIWYLCRVEH